MSGSDKATQHFFQVPGDQARFDDGIFEHFLHRFKFAEPSLTKGYEKH